MTFFGKFRFLRLYQTAVHREKRRFTGRLLFGSAAAGYGYYMYANYMDARSMEQRTGVPAAKMTMYRILPVNLMTHLAGKFAALEIPSGLRLPLFGLYAKMFGCNIDEADRPLVEYLTFNEFFARGLKTGSRPIDKSLLVAPSDGKVLAVGTIEPPFASQGVFPEQIKGVSYPLKDLVTDDVYAQLVSSKKPIHYCTIYLAPGDYHRFHSPTDWTQETAPVSVAGQVLSVAPFMMKWVKGLLCLNQRTILSGHWAHGRFTMIPVGATNVSSIVIDKEGPNKRQKGEQVGAFRMGSTVVLIFQAPKDFTWTRQPGETIKMGQALGDLPRSSWW